MDITDSVQQHGVLLFVAWYAVQAGIATMPPKGTVWRVGVFYDWFFDWAHMMLNIRTQLTSLREPPGQQAQTPHP